jgi:hypothetical protein
VRDLAANQLPRGRRRRARRPRRRGRSRRGRSDRRQPARSSVGRHPRGGTQCHPLCSWTPAVGVDCPRPVSARTLHHAPAVRACGVGSRPISCATLPRSRCHVRGAVARHPAPARPRRPRDHLGVSPGIDNTGIVHAVQERPAPMIPVTHGAAVRAGGRERLECEPGTHACSRR